MKAAAGRFASPARGRGSSVKTGPPPSWPPPPRHRRIGHRSAAPNAPRRAPGGRRGLPCGGRGRLAGAALRVARAALRRPPNGATRPRGRPGAACKAPQLVARPAASRRSVSRRLLPGGGGLLPGVHHSVKFLVGASHVGKRLPSQGFVSPRLGGPRRRLRAGRAFSPSLHHSSPAVIPPGAPALSAAPAKREGGRDAAHGRTHAQAGPACRAQPPRRSLRPPLLPRRAPSAGKAAALYGVPSFRALLWAASSKPGLLPPSLECKCGAPPFPRPTPKGAPPPRAPARPRRRHSPRGPISSPPASQRPHSRRGRAPGAAPLAPPCTDSCTGC